MNTIHISHTSISKAIDVIDNLDDDALDAISEKYAEQQPVLIGYAISAAQEYENEQLEGLVIYYFCLLNEAFAQQGVKCKQIQEEDLDTFETPFHEMLDQFFEEDDEAVLEDFCDQPDLHQFVAIEVSEEDEDGTSLNDDTATQLFIVMTAMITLLSNAIIME
jgi:hypothetical protein